MSSRSLSTPPPEDITPTQIKYTKKARHGHAKDVTDVHNIRQVAGCLPIDPKTNRFLLISSSKNPGAWVIPKGGWEMDETQEHAALRETWEEAGIKGHIRSSLGVFVERANKKIRAHHWIFELEIDEVCKKFPERKKRDRRWFTFDEAMLATQNNEYIQEAIKSSSINPAAQLTPRSSFEAKRDIPSPIISETQPLESSNNKQPSSDDSKKPHDAFQALKELVENKSTL